MFIGNYVMEGIAVRDQFKKRTVEMQRRVLQLMEDSNRDIWMCDPDDFTEKGR